MVALGVVFHDCRLRRASRARDDIAFLAGLSYTADIQAQTKAKADEYKKLALVLLSVHNLVAPIHRLPNEIPELILEDSTDRSSLLTQYQT